MNGGDRLAARDHAERLTRARPVDVEGYLLLGLLQLDDGAPEQAIESLRRAAFLDPDSVLTQFSLGRAYARLGDWARATRTLVHVRRLLAAMADEQPVRYGDGTLAGELRHAVSTQLAALDGARR